MFVLVTRYMYAHLYTSVLVLLSLPHSLSLFLAVHKPPPMYHCVARVTTRFAVPIKRQHGWKGEVIGSPM